MFKKTLFLLVTIILFLSVTSCSKAKTIGNSYKNESLGITITGPQGWYLEQSENPLSISVVFSKYQYSGKTPSLDNPAITLQVTKNMPSNFSAEQDINYVIKRVKEGNPNIKFYENPTKLTINGIEWLRVMYGSTTVTQMFYSYFKDRVIYSVITVAPADEFKVYRPVFEKVVNSISIR